MTAYVHDLAGVLLVDPRGWVLLQERDEHAPVDPDKWGLVGGHLEEGEDPQAGAHRELLEETGIRLAPEELRLWTELEVLVDDPRPTAGRMRVFAAPTTLTDADIVCGEGRRIVFVDPEVIPALDLARAARQAVELFLASPVYAGMVT